MRHFVLMLLLSGCTAKNFAARVGEFTISADDAHQRDLVDEIEAAGSGARHYGLQRLVRQYQMAEVAKKYGFEFDDLKLVIESTRIERETTTPTSLKRIKAVFGEDTAAYRRVYVLPNYAERALFEEVFAKSPKIQAAELEAPKSFIREAKARPREMMAFAQRRGLATRVVHDPYLARELKPGDVYFKPLNTGTGDAWIVARLVKLDEIETVEFPKANYDKWLAAELADVKVEKP